MGKGDSRTKKGKIKQGSYGNSRPKTEKILAEKKKKSQ
ncbi:30S ribosomal protein THX [bacterium]|nr:30S ribosomal protein THX [bacterium]